MSGKVAASTIGDMGRYLVEPSGPLVGTVRVAGATKNEGTKLMAAALLAPGVHTINNIPRVVDLDIMIELLEVLGARIARTGPESLEIDTSGPIHADAPYELVRRMRASI